MWLRIVHCKRMNGQLLQLFCVVGDSLVLGLLVSVQFASAARPFLEGNGIKGRIEASQVTADTIALAA